MKYEATTEKLTKKKYSINISLFSFFFLLFKCSQFLNWMKYQFLYLEIRLLSNLKMLKYKELKKQKLK